MAYRIKGRDSFTGEPTELFYGEHGDETAALEAAISKGIIVDSIERLAGEQPVDDLAHEQNDTVRTPRFRFSLRLLLLFMLAAGIWFGWIGYHMQADRRLQQSAKDVLAEAASIESVGGKVIWKRNLGVIPEALRLTPFGQHDDEGVYWIEGVVMRNTDDGKLEELAALTQFPIKSIYLGGKGVTDSGLDKLSYLTELRLLRFYNTRITQKGADRLQQALPKLRMIPSPEQLNAIANLKKLGGKINSSLDRPYKHHHFFFNQGQKVGLLSHSETKRPREQIWIDLSHTEITDSELVHMKRLASSRFAISLILRWEPITDAGLEHLRGLSSLDQLYLGDTHVGDKGLKNLANLLGLGILDLENTQVTDAGLHHLKRLKELRRLELGGTEITDAGLANLEPLTKITDLGLNNTKVTGAGLVHLEGQSELEDLSLRGNQIADTDLVILRNMTHLKTLDLSHTQVTDDGLELLRSLPKLSTVLLDKTQLTDTGAEYLKGMVQLRYLSLSKTQITNEALPHLGGLFNLEILYLNQTAVNDEGLEHLKGLTTLKSLNLYQTQVTEEGVEKLQEVLPNCRIQY